MEKKIELRGDTIFLFSEDYGKKLGNENQSKVN